MRLVNCTLMPGHVRSVEEVRWDAEQQIVVARRVERLGALVLDSASPKKADLAKLRVAMLECVRRLGLDVRRWTVKCGADGSSETLQIAESPEVITPAVDPESAGTTAKGAASGNIAVQAVGVADTIGSPL